MIEPLLEIMRRLRDPQDGCDWDKVQTFETIAPYTIEEAYEVADAIGRKDMAELKSELGDLLFQVVFHSKIAEDKGHFAFNDVVDSICAKMERRHPHIFGDAEQSPGWEELKANERSESDNSSALDGVALALPSLLRAHKIQKRAARVGFDWPDLGPVKAKLHEELDEIERAESDPELQEEIGDFLFAAVNLARHHGVDAEQALSRANEKFVRRFQKMEELAGEAFENLPLEKQEELWQHVKKEEDHLVQAQSA